jgi:hypothetical protein
MIPLWLKLSYTLFVLVTVAVYSVKYRLGNFLWFSDIAMIATVPALWLESSLLASMMALAIVLPEVFWNVTYFGRLLTGRRLAGLTDYMFDAQLPFYLRALSLFHVFLPVLLLWMIGRLGYAREAWLSQTVLAGIVLPLTYLLTDPVQNINWVRGPGTRQQTLLHPQVYLFLLLIGFSLLIYLPTHLLLRALFN